MPSSRPYPELSGLLAILLSWCVAFALLLQLAGAPALALRNAAASFDPVRAAQLLCTPSDSGTPLDHHRNVPVQDHWQCPIGHNGFVTAFLGYSPDATRLTRCFPSLFQIANAALSLRVLFAAYAARAPPYPA